MPELPEVETIRRALDLRLAGRRVQALVQRRASLRFPLPDELARRVVGRVVLAVRRRAKYLVVDFEGGESMLLHLGMSGRLVFDGPALGAHEHITFEFDDGCTLRFVDPRRFGMLDLTATAGLASHPRLARLGVEPLDPGFGGKTLRAALAGRRTALKLALMDQRIVVGVGNIYASESLFRARLSPQRIAGDVRPAEAARLARAIRSVLEDAIAAGGSTLRDYVQTDGELGFFQHLFAVYGRSGLPCTACGGEIRRLVQGSRATFFCARCQK